MTASDTPARGNAWTRLQPLQKGILCTVVVTLCFVSMDSMAKSLTQTYDTFFVVWARYFGQALGALLIFAPQLTRIMRTQRLGLQILRSCLLFIATLLFFGAVSVMPLAQVTAIAQTAPLAITAMAALFLAERVGPYRWAAVVAGFLGALVIIRPGGADFGWQAVLPVVGALAFAAYSVSTRFLSAADSVWTTFFYTGLVGAIAASLAVPFFWETPALADIPLFAVMAFLGGAGQALLIIGMSYVAASVLAPFFYLSLVWSVAFGFLFFGEVPQMTTILGASIIVGAGFFVRWREQLRAREAERVAQMAGQTAGETVAHTAGEMAAQSAAAATVEESTRGQEPEPGSRPVS